MKSHNPHEFTLCKCALSMASMSITLGLAPVALPHHFSKWPPISNYTPFETLILELNPNSKFFFSKSQTAPHIISIRLVGAHQHWSKASENPPTLQILFVNGFNSSKVNPNNSRRTLSPYLHVQSFSLNIDPIPLFLSIFDLLY